MEEIVIDRKTWEAVTSEPGEKAFFQVFGDVEMRWFIALTVA
jgi:hypothetical protein